jgi:hypothetical protein
MTRFSPPPTLTHGLLISLHVVVAAHLLYNLSFFLLIDTCLLHTLLQVLFLLY